jgi:hypothetical protein
MVACGVADPDGLPGSVVAKAHIGGLVAVVDAFGFRLPGFRLPVPSYTFCPFLHLLTLTFSAA